MEHEGLKDGDGQVQSGRRAQQPGNQEKPGARLLRRHVKPLSQKLVDGGQAEPVILREQNRADERIAHAVPEDQLQVSEMVGRHLTGHRNVADTGKGIPNETQGDPNPRRTPIPGEVSGVVGLAASPPSHRQQRRKIGAHTGQDRGRLHGLERITSERSGARGKSKSTRSGIRRFPPKWLPKSLIELSPLPTRHEGW